MSALQQRRRFTADEYERLGSVGILHEDERVELIDGEIIIMDGMGPDHIDCIGRLNELLMQAKPPGVLVNIQVPIRLNDRSEPEPDLVVYRDLRERRVPAPPNILLVIEVSDSTLTYDRQTKLPLYAAAEIPEAWLVNLVDRRIERHTLPREGRYRQVEMARAGQGLPSTVIPELMLTVEMVIVELS